MKDNELYYDLAKFETEMVATRSNFLLVFQSMLFAATAALAVSEKETYFPSSLLIVLGLISSGVWLVLNWATVVVAREALKELSESEDSDIRINSLFDSIKRKKPVYRLVSTDWIMVWVFPTITGVTWAVLLLNYLAKPTT